MANKLSKRYFGTTGGTTPKIPIRFKTGGTVYEGYIVNQVGARRFKCADDGTNVADGSLVVGNQYVIESVGDSDFTAAGALYNAVNGRPFTATSVGGSGTGVVNTVVTATLVQGTNSDPANNGEATLVGINATGNPVTLKKINFRTATDFNGNRYKWSLSNDSSQTLLILTAI